MADIALCKQLRQLQMMVASPESLNHLALATQLTKLRVDGLARRVGLRSLLPAVARLKSLRAFKLTSALDDSLNA